MAIFSGRFSVLEPIVKVEENEVKNKGANDGHPTTASFTELHDYVDANGYGGAFEDGAPSPADPIWNAVQEQVDRWLKRGRR